MAHQNNSHNAPWLTSSQTVFTWRLKRA